MRFHNILQKIGNTPIIKLNKIKVKPSVEIWGKLENQNPGGSVKDRPALFMIEDAERKGLLTPEKIVIEASSGNTGIGLSLVCTVKGYKCIIVMPESVSMERKKLMQAFGAEILLTPGNLGTDGAIETVYEMLRKYPEKYFCPDQFNNPANWLSHYKTTGPEIWRDTKGKVTHIVCGLGTTGTAMGIAYFAKDNGLPFKVVGVEPKVGHKIPGLKNMKESYPPSIYDKKLLEKVISVEDEEAFYWVRRLAKDEGIFVGMSSGAALAGAIKLAEEIKEGIIVVIFPDGGERYLSTPLWSFDIKEIDVTQKADLILTNTFSGKREIFKPLNEKLVKIYTCGPTLNIRPHIGIYRRLLIVDILKNYLKLKGYKIFHVVNLTDFDDKTIHQILLNDLDLKEFTSQLEREFYQDLDWLKIERADLYPKVSDHLEDLKEIALKILEKDKAYIKYSSLYFDISKFYGYGELSKINLKFLKPGATIDLEEYDKDEPFDFVLLKRVQILELKKGYFIETFFGKVRPTWHIHCAGLILKYLGEEIDIFTGGADLIFPHHENTRAVAKALTEKEIAKYWIHSDLVFYEKKKLSSENGITVEDIKNRGFSGRILRLYFLRTHYRNRFNFSWKGLEESAKIIQKIDRYLAYLEASPENKNNSIKEELESILNEFEKNWKDALKEDLNTPLAISELISFFKKIYTFLKNGISSEYKRKIWDSLKEFNQVFKILIFPQKIKDEKIIEKLKQRDDAKKEGNYQLADKIREEIENIGFYVFDLPSGGVAVRLEEE